MLQIGFEVSSIQNLWERLTNPEQSESAQQASENLEHPLWNHNAIAQALGVRNNRSEPIEASFWLRAVGAQRFFAFGDKSVDHLRSGKFHFLSLVFFTELCVRTYLLWQLPSTSPPSSSVVR